MKLYHRTSNENAGKILEAGFIDHAGGYGTPGLYSGVWLSNIPLDENEGACGDTLFSIKIPIAVIREYEWIEDGKPYREFLIPAEIVNRYIQSLNIESVRKPRPLNKRLLIREG